MSTLVKPAEWFALSEAQRSRWFLYQFDAGVRGSHNNGFAVRIHARVEPDRVACALQRLVDRHPMLRTAFRECGGAPEQGVCARAPVSVSCEAIPESALSSLAERVQADCGAAFDPAAPPLIRAHLYHCPDQDTVLLLVFDHLVGDGWSYWHLLDELDLLLRDESGTANVLDEAPSASYADYVEWQRQWLSSDQAEAQFGYWRKMLADVPPTLSLPADPREIAATDARQDAVTVHVPAALVERLRDLTKQYAGTLFTTLLGAYQLLLHRYSGQDDIVVGAPMPGRSRSEWDHVVGDFVNPIALRCRFEPGETVLHCLKRVRNTALRGMGHQDFPFGLLVERLQPPRVAGEHPLFQTLFTFQKARRSAGLLDLWAADDNNAEIEWGGYPVSTFPVHQSGGGDELPLALEVAELGSDIRCDFEFDPKRFGRATIERMSRHYLNLLGALCDDPGMPVDRLPLLTVEERDQLLCGFNTRRLEYREQPVHALFERQAAMRPEAIAVVAGTQSLTYGELNRRANQLARKLLQLGVGRDDRVALCVERDLPMLIGLLGVLKAGAAYLPLDPGLPAERMAFILSDGAPVVLLTQSSLVDALPATEIPRLLLDDEATYADQSIENPDLPVASDALAYVLYTSGSTGQPKGVMVEHGNVLNLVHTHIENCSLRASDCMLQFASYAFDISVEEIFPPLAVGAKIVLRPDDLLSPDETYLQLLSDQAVTIADLPTSFWVQWAQTQTADQSARLPALRLLVVGGEKFDRRHLAQWKDSPLGRRTDWLHNYGPTEATVYTSALFLTADQPIPAGDVSIGRPNPNTRIYLLDAELKPVPIGVSGEIHVGGRGVARGYLNRPDLSAERFLPDPFCDEPGARLYKTGDLGRWLANGEIEFQGRNDFQVKIRGYRVELGEIERRLAECAGVRDVAVICREDNPGDKRLVAYLVAEAGAELVPLELRAQLAAELVDYMVPVAYVVLPALPLTSNDKLDRAALPLPDASAMASRPYLAPEGAIECTLAAIWTDLLKLERVGRDDHFFECGGHSLLALQLAARIRDSLGCELAVRELFAHPTLRAQAAHLAGQQAQPVVEAAIEIADRTQPLPLSFAQQRLWLVDRLDARAGAAYHMPACLQLRGSLDRNALQAALARIVARHEVLRTCFVERDGQPWQQIAPPDTGFALPLRDLGTMDIGSREVLIEELMREEAQRPFDLTRGPLIRGQLLRLADDEHLLLLTQHHIISDGWSVGVLLEELSALYRAFVAGAADPLPTLPVQYADYALWQRQWLTPERLQRQQGFWQDYLQGAPELLALPNDRPRPLQPSYVGARCSLQLPASLTQNLQQLARRHDCSLYMTLLAGWAVLMARLSGQDDVVIGTPVANRQRREVEALLGFFVNTLALRVRLHDAPSVAGLLARVRDDSLRALDHQDLPFEQVVEAAQPNRSLAHSPLFQVMLAYDNTPAAKSFELAGLECALRSTPGTSAHLDLVLELTESAQGGLQAELVYATDLFDESSVQRLLSRFQRVLQSMADDATQAVAAIDLLDADEHRELVVARNQTRRDYPRHSLIHHEFEQQAARRPDAIALEFQGERLTYAELDRRANRLAHFLRGCGVVQESRVAICVERDPDLVIGLLAILKAGGAYVPLDPGYPGERLTYLLNDSAPVVVITDAVCSAALPTVSVPVLRLDLEQAIIAEYPADMPPAAPVGVSGESLAYLLYTSGSTGQPKGVMVSHRNVLRLVLNNTFAPIGESDCVAHYSNPAFDASTWELWAPLLNGARLRLFAQDTVLAPERFAAELAEAGVTAMWMTVGLFNQYVDHLDAAWASMRYLLVGGDALDPHSVSRLLAKPQRPQHVVNGYGPTECTTFSICGELVEIDPQQSVALGLPIANTRIYLLDGNLRPVPPGVAGEIYIGGDGVARGYWNRPDLTTERFIDDPFDDAPVARMYRSGDLGYWRADGRIGFLGRNDAQIKIRGFRVELGEIETALAAIAGVRDSVVVLREDAPGDKRLVAYCVLEADRSLTAADLRAELATQLPEYMLPGAYVALDAIPLTANGKVDRRALPMPGDAAHAQRSYVAPVGAIEQTVAAIWRELLGVEQIGRDDHFFELGGHSLLAVRLLAAVRRELGVELGLRDLFLLPRLADFCAGIAIARPAAETKIESADRSQPLPLSFAQQRLWLVDRLDKRAGAAYHMPACLQLCGRLDTVALQSALARIVARHEVLRTRFVEIDGQPWQQIDPADIGFALPLHDLRALDATSREALVDQAMRDEAQRPFDLAIGPMIRGQLLQLADDEHLLLLTQHHIISDGWSVGLLLDELSALYRACAAGEPDPLPAPSLQYADYAAWQRHWLDAERVEAQQRFWQAHLQDAPELLALPIDRPRPAQPSHVGARCSLQLPAALTRELQQLSQRHGCSLYMTLLTGWALLMSRLSGQDDVVIGTPVANRQRREIESLLGFFVNTLPLRMRLHGAPTVAELLARVRDDSLQALDHQDLPFEQILEAVQPNRALAYSPLFQVMLAYNNTPGPRELALAGVQATVRESGHDPAHFDLSLSLTDADGGLRGELIYSTDLFDASRMQRLLDQFACVLRAMVDDAERRIDRIDLLGGAERRRLLHDFNQTRRDYPRDALIHHLFEARANQRPDAVALVFGQRTLSYAELNRQANRWAHRLLALGVKPDDRVAIWAERSVEMTVAMLAVLKSGAAYLPIDTSYPSERVADMLADAEPVAVLVGSDLIERLPATDRPVLLLDGEKELQAQPDHDPQVPGLTASNLAYVIYTSGSTGKAKGVMVEHRNVVQLVIDNPFAVIGVDDCVVHCANPAFDASTWEIWGALLVGARVCVVPQAVLLDPPAFAGELIRANVTAAFLTVSLFIQYAEALQEALPRLNYLLFGGEKTDLRQIARVFNHYAPRHLVHVYGPTETTTFATALDIPALPEGATVLPIGRPIGNARIYILDALQQPVPIGVPGEIYVGGDGVARGYLNRPDLNAERFLPDPFMTATADHDANSPRMYRTGDLARWLEDGSVEYLARNDDQVKIRGFRIELGEVASRLRQCAGVIDALTTVREDSPGDKRLIAYLCVEPGVELSLPTLRAQLAAHLADYMVPSSFVPMTAFPLTQNGKVDRRALPVPGADHVVARPYEAPEGDTEQALAELWAELFGLSRVGRHDHFFELGGHSLLAVQLAGRIRTRLLVDLPLRELFEHPVLFMLADRITALQFEQYMTDDLDAMKSELASLSEAELRALLDAEGASVE